MVTNSFDDLSNICSLIMADGADLLGWGHGQFTLFLFGLLLPVATIFFLTSAGLALSGNKGARRVSIGFLSLGIVILALFVGLCVYAMIFGQNWAHAAA